MLPQLQGDPPFFGRWNRIAYENKIDFVPLAHFVDVPNFKHRDYMIPSFFEYVLLDISQIAIERSDQ